MEINKIAKNKAGKYRPKRAAAYARVSVANADTANSLANQVSYYQNKITKDPELIFFRIYADSGLSGTKQNRPEFLQMMEDARNHKFDILITKSVTRLARNVVTLLSTVRELKSLGIDVYFEKENLHTLSEAGEMMLTMLAVYAEEEARSASENVKWSYRKRFEKGEGVMKEMYGYRVVDGKYQPVPEEAEIVRRIFKEYLDGSSLYGITKRLINDGITRNGGRKWNITAISTMLSNEKYTGNMILQKTYRPDFRTKKTEQNKGQWRKYYVEGTHEAIIDVETFTKVQEEKIRRKAERPNYYSRTPGPENLFYKKVECSECGLYYKRTAIRDPKYKKTPWYTCYAAKAFREEKCKSHIIKEETLIDKTKEVLKLADETTLTREMIDKKIKRIICTPDFKLIYQLQNGKEVTVDWRDYFYGTKSRRQACSERASQQWQNGSFKKQTKAQGQTKGGK